MNESELFGQEAGDMESWCLVKKQDRCYFIFLRREVA